MVIANKYWAKEPTLGGTNAYGRLIIFDTETTRLGTWDSIVEIDAVELLN